MDNLNSLELDEENDNDAILDIVLTSLSTPQNTADRSSLSFDDKLNLAEKFIADKLNGQYQNYDEESPHCKLKHTFTPGMYIREIFMPAGVILTTKVHKFEHPFVILKGRVSVCSENDGPQLLVGPYRGITKPNTRRLLIVHEDTIWITYHLNPLEKRNLVDIGHDLTYHYDNPLLAEDQRPKEVGMNHTKTRVELA